MIHAISLQNGHGAHPKKGITVMHVKNMLFMYYLYSLTPGIPPNVGDFSSGT